MDPVHRELLRRHRLQLADQIAASDTVVHFLYQESVLTHDHVEEIQSQPTSRGRALRLLDLLPSRGPRAFDTFLRSLEEEFTWVKDTLLRDLADSQQQHSANGSAPKGILAGGASSCWRCRNLAEMQREQRNPVSPTMAITQGPIRRFRD